MPIVLYNGESRWTACKSYKDYLRNFDMFGEYTVDFNYILLSVNGYTDEELLELANLISLVFVIDKAKDFKGLMETLRKMIEPLKIVSPEEYLMFKHWLKNIATSRMTIEQKREVTEAIENSEGVENLRYNLERAITNELEEVKAEGKAEGKIAVAQNLLQIGIDIQTIIKATELPEEIIMELKKKLQH